MAISEKAPHCCECCDLVPVPQHLKVSFSAVGLCCLKDVEVTFDGDGVSQSWGNAISQSGPCKGYLFAGLGCTCKGYEMSVFIGADCWGNMYDSFPLTLVSCEPFRLQGSFVFDYLEASIEPCQGCEDQTIRVDITE